MSITELKKKLKEKIENLNEDYLLEELLNIIDLELTKNDLVQIPKEHKEKLNISLVQAKEGNTISHESVMKECKNDLKS